MTILNIYINNESCLESELLVSIAQVDSRFSNILGNVFLVFFCINFIRSLRLPQEHNAHLGGSRTLTNYNKTHNTQQTENK